MEDVVVSADCSAIDATISDLDALLASGRLSNESVMALLDVFDTSEFWIQVSQVETLTTPTGAIEMRITLQLPERLTELIAAIRASEVDGRVQYQMSAGH